MSKEGYGESLSLEEDEKDSKVNGNHSCSTAYARYSRHFRTGSRTVLDCVLCPLLSFDLVTRES